MSALVKALVALVAMAAVAELAAAKNYTIQWSVGGNYGDWSDSNAVSVGDTVVFTYGPPHTVDELPSEADYKACSFANKVSTDSSGSTAFTFDKAGTTRYFACAAGSHCSLGQKVAITAAAASGASPQSPTPAAPKGNSAAPPMAIAAKVALGLGVGAALFVAAF